MPGNYFICQLSVSTISNLHFSHTKQTEQLESSSLLSQLGSMSSPSTAEETENVPPETTSPLKKPSDPHERPDVEFLIATKKRKLQLVADSDEIIKDPIVRKPELPSVPLQGLPSLSLAAAPELSAPDSPSGSITDGPSVKSKCDILTHENNGESKENVQEMRGEESKLTVNELRRKERKLDLELRKAKMKLQSLKRAQNIIEKKESEKTQGLIIKWRDAAQKASNYLLNAAIDKINKSGGKREFNRREKDQLRENIEYSIDNSFQDRLHEITNSEQYQALSEKEKENILEDLDKEQETALEEAERTFLKSDDDECEDEFSMKDLYKKLKLDYKLVFPDNE